MNQHKLQADTIPSLWQVLCPAVVVLLDVFPSPPDCAIALEPAAKAWHGNRHSSGWLQQQQGQCKKHTKAWEGLLT